MRQVNYILVFGNNELLTSLQMLVGWSLRGPDG